MIINCGALLTGAALILRSTDGALLTALYWRRFTDGLPRVRGTTKIVSTWSSSKASPLSCARSRSLRSSECDHWRRTRMKMMRDTAAAATTAATPPPTSTLRSIADLRQQRHQQPNKTRISSVDDWLDCKRYTKTRYRTLPLFSIFYPLNIILSNVTITLLQDKYIIKHT